MRLRICILSICLFSSGNADEKVDIALERMLNNVEFQKAVIAMEESYRDKQMSIGDNGKARGSFQIWNCVVQDVNRIYKTRYKHTDAHNTKDAVDIFKKYLQYWGKRYYLNTGKLPGYDTLGRIWNGGPSGWRKRATEGYGGMIKNAMSLYTY